MTAQSFSAYLDETPHTVHTLPTAADARGFSIDGYVWIEGPRQFVGEGGEWPYYIAAWPMRDPLSDTDATRPAFPVDLWSHHDTTPEGQDRAARTLETYCEGDLTAYVFESVEDRNGAIRAWEEAEADYAARLIEDQIGDPASPELGAAVLAEMREAEGASTQPDADNIRATMDRYRGNFGSVEDYIREMYPEQVAAIEDNAADRLIQVRIDWDDTALALQNTESTNYSEHDGHYFGAV